MSSPAKAAECSDQDCAQINAAPRVFGTNECYKDKDSQSRGDLPVSK